MVEGGKIAGPFTRQKDAPHFKARDELFQSLFEVQMKLMTSESVIKRDIKITLPDGKVVAGKSFETSPFAIAKSINKKLAENAVVAKVTYTHKDVSPLDDNMVVNTGPEDEVPEAEDLDKLASTPHGQHQYVQPNKAAFELYDLHRPLEGDCLLEILDFNDPLGKMVFYTYI